MLLFHVNFIPKIHHLISAFIENFMIKVTDFFGLKYQFKDN